MILYTPEGAEGFDLAEGVDEAEGVNVAEGDDGTCVTAIYI
mgnify:CR=1 FL=1